MSNQQQFEMAVMLSSMACELDYAKNAYEPSLRESTAVVVKKMHELAETLAGARAAEIYGKDDTEVQP